MATDKCQADGKALKSEKKLKVDGDALKGDTEVLSDMGRR